MEYNAPYSEKIKKLTLKSFYRVYNKIRESFRENRKSLFKVPKIPLYPEGVLDFTPKRYYPYTPKGYYPGGVLGEASPSTPPG